MMKTHYEKSLPGARLWTGDMEVEADAIEQIRKVTQLPILAGPVAVMPDVHLGKGATVGTVIPTRAAIVPAAVGVDIDLGDTQLRGGQIIFLRHAAGVGHLAAGVIDAVDPFLGHARRAVHHQRETGQ